MTDSLKALLAENSSMKKRIKQLEERIECHVEGRLYVLSILKAWEPRITCPQCGERYTENPCGFAHSALRSLIESAP